MKACGILFCYNEAHILKECIVHYLREGINLVIFDNMSTDTSMHIVRALMQQEGCGPGKIMDVVSVETVGYEWGKILRRACAYMHERLSGYEWILLIDADSFYGSPVKGVSLITFMDHMQSKGYNIIDGALRQFYPTEKDDPSVAAHTERMRYFTKDFFPFCPQHKIFRYHPSIDFYSQWGHHCIREDARVAPVKFIYRHYPYVSFDHGLKKIFSERNSRYVDRKRNLALNPQYGGLLPIEKDLVKRSSELLSYDAERIRMTALKMRLLIMFRDLIVRYNGMRKKRYKKRQERKSIHEHIYLTYPPKGYHFLPTNYCNSSCVFCSQRVNPADRKELTFEDFKLMFSHIPIVDGMYFYFSGGGEPLLCGDLIRIIRFVNEHAPRVNVYLRTNGLLLRKHAEALAQLRIARLECSIHGAKRSTHEKFTTSGKVEDVFEGLAAYKTRASQYGNNARTVLCVAVNRSNIDEIPDCIRKAHDIGAQTVRVSFIRYYPDDHINVMMGKGSSLYFERRRYDAVIRNARLLAHALNIILQAEPLFGEKYKAASCVQPWQNILVDWDGNIYPCCGGEVWFKESVRSGKRYFGNLLKEDCHQYWNNISYTMIRRTCSPFYSEEFVDECRDCHNTMSIRGPNCERSHILRPV